MFFATCYGLNYLIHSQWVEKYGEDSDDIQIVAASFYPAWDFFKDNDFLEVVN